MPEHIGVSLNYSDKDLSRLEVYIRGERRVPKYTEALALPESLHEQARIFGRAVFAQGKELAVLLSDSSFREKQGLSESVYTERIKPFLQMPNSVAYFGADGVIDTEGVVKFVEINSQPQVLGRFDYVRDTLGVSSKSSTMAEDVSGLIKEATSEGSIPLILSHPSNAFYGHHVLFAEQTGMQITSLQNLDIRDSHLYFNGRKVGSVVKLFSTNTLMDRTVVNEEMYQILTSGEVRIFNGLLTPFMGDKLFLKHVVDSCPHLSGSVPEMRTLSLGDTLDMKEYAGWWLKADARKRLELTINLNKDDMRGWTGKVLQAMVQGDFSQAYSYLEGRETPTAHRYREYLDGVREEEVGKFLLQKNIEPMKVSVVEGGQPVEVNTLLRAYFVPKSLDGDDVNVYFELLAGKSLRVSLAGLGIPVKNL